MEFFDKLGKKATEAYKITADKTGKLAKETKLKLKITELKSQINDVYEEIGKRVYQKHIREEDENFEKEVEEMCVKVDVLSDEINSLLKQCLELKDRKQCKNCYVEIDRDSVYCKNCGAKQEELGKEVEVIEKPENSEEQKENEIEEQTDAKEEQQVVKHDEKENSDNMEQEKEDLQKTVEIESNVNLEDE